VSSKFIEASLDTAIGPGSEGANTHFSPDKERFRSLSPETECPVPLALSAQMFNGDCVASRARLTVDAQRAVVEPLRSRLIFHSVFIPFKKSVKSPDAIVNPPNQLLSLEKLLS
jgi:hypothetical protein